MKTCTKCKIDKDFKEFSKDRSKVDGYCCSCKACSKLKDKLSTLKHREKRLVRDRKYHMENRDTRNANRLALYKETYVVTRPKRDKEYYKQYYKDYWFANKEKKLKQARERNAIRREEDPIFKLALNLRGRLNKAVRKGFKKGSAVSDLGCSIEEFKKYLESKFKPGMTWDNYGRKGWHIDHIIPLTKVDLTNLEEFKMVVHYTNLQPLWWDENLSKGNR